MAKTKTPVTKKKISSYYSTTESSESEQTLEEIRKKGKGITIHEPEDEPVPKKVKVQQFRGTTRTLFIPRYIQWEVFESLEFDTLELFRAQGWEKLVTLKMNYYPKLVYEFYRTRFADESDRFSVKIKGKRFLVTIKKIYEALEIPNEGNEIGSFKDVGKIKGYNEMDFRETLFPGQDLDKIGITDFPSQIKILHSMIIYFLHPRTGSHSYFNRLDWCILWHLLNKIPMNLGFLIYKTILRSSTVRSLPYGMFLTVLFEHWGVDLTGEKIGKPLLVIKETYGDKKGKTKVIEEEKEETDEEDTNAAEKGKEEKKKKKEKVVPENLDELLTQNLEMMKLLKDTSTAVQNSLEIALQVQIQTLKQKNEISLEVLTILRRIESKLDQLIQSSPAIQPDQEEEKEEEAEKESQSQNEEESPEKEATKAQTPSSSNESSHSASQTKSPVQSSSQIPAVPLAPAPPASPVPSEPPAPLPLSPRHATHTKSSAKRLPTSASSPPAPPVPPKPKKIKPSIPTAPLRRSARHGLQTKTVKPGEAGSSDKPLDL